MKIQPIISRFFFYASALLLTACYTNVIEYGDGSGDGGDGSGDGNGGDVNPSEGIVIAPEEMNQTLYADEQTLVLHFTSPNSWTARIEGDEMYRGWIALDREEGYEAGSETELKVYIDQNLTGSPREISILLSDYSSTRDVRITQMPEYPDGTMPEPFLPPTHSQMVKRIICKTENSDWYRSYEFFEENQQLSISFKEISSQEGTADFISYGREISVYKEPGFAYIENTAYVNSGDAENPSLDVVSQKTGRYYLNSRNEITYEITQEEDITSGSQTEEQIASFWYTGGYMIKSFTDYQYIQYTWEYGDLISESFYDPISGYAQDPHMEYTYTSYPHPDCNININKLYLLNFSEHNILKLTDLYGVSSANLVETVTEYGTQYHYNYEFDAQGRVAKVTEPNSGTIYEIEYQ